jgi:hypothetical protein
MRPLFPEKASKIGSLISLITVTAMLTVFSLILPEFLVSTVGRIFMVVWALTAIFVFVAHTRRISLERRPLPLSFVKEVKDIRTKKKEPKHRMMRG